MKSRSNNYERRILLYALAAGLPGTLVSALLLFLGDYSAKVAWTLLLLIGSFWLGFAFAVRRRVVYPLQTVSNLLAAIREEDFSIRARGTRGEDALAEVMREVNALSGLLGEQRLGALEASALLRKVMEEIEVAVFAFDADLRLRLVNRAGERLLGLPSERLLGLTASDLGLVSCLEGETTRTVQMRFPAGTGRWEIRRSPFRQAGLPLQLLVVTDLSRALREEERAAWQRLIRVLGHELNNSLAPIQSVAQSLESRLPDRPAGGRSRGGAEAEEDLRSGLRLIRTRAESLSRFMASYAQLARLPQPRLTSVNVAAWVERAASMETRVRVNVFSGPAVTLQADSDQLDQLLINLLRNAADAALEGHGSIEVGWRKNGRFLEVWVRDQGPGIANPANLFVPFFTTKPGGSGIGLALSRQIAEAHGGTLTLENRQDTRGCEARLRLPL